MNDWKKGDKVKTKSKHIKPPQIGEVRRVCKDTVYVQWDGDLGYGSWPKDSVENISADLRKAKKSFDKDWKNLMGA